MATDVISTYTKTMKLAMGLRVDTVPRWAVVPTVQKQTVGGHIQRGAAILMFLKPHLNVSGLVFSQVLEEWLEHDEDEAATGDTPSPSKGKPNVLPQCQKKAIVKTVDWLEARRFLQEDHRLGNWYARPNGPVAQDLSRKLDLVPSAGLFKWHGLDPRELLDKALSSVHEHPGMEGI
jgi:hypothetical protein